MHIQVLGIFISKVGRFWPQSWALDLLHSLYKMLGHGIPKKNPYHKTQKMFVKNCPPKNIWREISTTKNKRHLYQKLLSSKVPTQNSDKRKSLRKNLWRDILYQKMSEEKSLPNISAKNLCKKYIYMKRQKRHSLPFFWRASLPKRNEETSLPKKLTINGYQKAKDISAKKFQEKFQQKRISQAAIFYQNNFMKNIDQQIFEE